MVETKVRRPRGKGNITPSGYIRLRIGNSKTGYLILEHRKVWEDKYGKVPEGLEIYHVNGDKQDNAIENLLLVDRLTHRRIHAGWLKIEGEWHKECPYCNRILPTTKDNFYFTTENNKNRKAGEILFGRCKQCHVRIVCEKRRANG